MTPEVYALNIRDVSASRWKTKTVRWNRHTSVRLGERFDGNFVHRIADVHDRLPEAAYHPESLIRSEIS